MSRWSWRWQEALLLVVASALTLATRAEWLLAEGRTTAPRDFAPLLLLITAHAAFHVWLSLDRRRIDELILPAVALLQGLGVNLAFRLAPAAGPTSPDLAARQLAWALAGLVAAWAFVARPRATMLLRRYQYSAALVGAVLVALAMALGAPPRQAARGCGSGSGASASSPRRSRSWRWSSFWPAISTRAVSW